MIHSHFLCSISPAPMILPSRATPTSLAPPLSTNSSHIDGNRSLSIRGQTFQTEKIMLMEMSLSFKPELCNYDKAPIGAGQLLCQCPYWSDVHHLLWGEIKPPTSTCSFPSSLCESLWSSRATGQLWSENWKGRRGKMKTELLCNWLGLSVHQDFLLRRTHWLQ